MYQALIKTELSADPEAAQRVVLSRSAGPTYEGELWIASATLAITFPLLATHTDFFDHWPLRSGEPVAVGTEEEELPASEAESEREDPSPSGRR
jgi:hypothetical protein